MYMQSIGVQDLQSPFAHDRVIAEWLDDDDLCLDGSDAFVPRRKHEVARTCLQGIYMRIYMHVGGSRHTYV